MCVCVFVFVCVYVQILITISNLIVIAHIYLTKVWVVGVKRRCEGDQQGPPEVRKLLLSLGPNMTTCLLITV